MAESLLATLNSILDRRSISSVAEALGIPEESAEKGLRSAIVAVLGGIASKAESPESLRGVLDLAPKLLVDNPLLQAARCAPDPNSSLFITGRHLLVRIFGNCEDTVSGAVGAVSGLSTASASTLLAMVAPLVMGFIGNHARLQGMNMTILGNILKQETPALREELPAGLENLFWPKGAASVSSSVTSLAAGGGTSWGWVRVLAAGLLILGLILLFSRHRRPPAPTAAPTTAAKEIGSASRNTDDPVETVRLALGKMELYFDGGSARLRPESRGQLDTIASTLASYPDVHLTLTGHGDRTRRQERGSGLSKRRATAVMAELIQRGVPPDHLTAEGASNEKTTSDHYKVTLEFSEH